MEPMGGEGCSDDGCNVDDGPGAPSEEGSLLAVSVERLRLAKAADGGVCNGKLLGILNLDGYYYPTQPGDVNDKRTWCTVRQEDVDRSDYDCANATRENMEFGVSFRVVRGFTFAEAQRMNQADHREAFKEALRGFLKDNNVCAITCSVGFCSAFQSVAKEVTNEIIDSDAGARRKPMLLGTPSLLPAFTDRVYGNDIRWGLLDPQDENDRILVITSAYPSLSGDDKLKMLKYVGLANYSLHIDLSNPKWQLLVSAALERKFGIKVPKGMAVETTRFLAEFHASLRCELSEEKARQEMRRWAKKFVVVGWNGNSGYAPVVVGGGFHNVWQMQRELTPWVKEKINRLRRQGWDVRAIILESTEMPAHSNQLRQIVKVPVWDISTLGQCLMKTAWSVSWWRDASHRRDLYVQLFRNPDFQACMRGWSTHPLRIETKFGTQEDGRLKFYENLDEETLRDLTCRGGRMNETWGIGREMGKFDPGLPYRVGSVRKVCQTTELCRCPPVDCPGACPGSGNCGGGSENFQMTVKTGTKDYPCGVHGDRCDALNSVPPLLPNPDDFSYPIGLVCPPRGNTMSDDDFR